MFGNVDTCESVSRMKWVKLMLKYKLMFIIQLCYRANGQELLSPRFVKSDGDIVIGSVRPCVRESVRAFVRS